MPLLWHSLSRGSVAPPPSPEGLFPSMEGIRGGQLCAEGPMCRRPKLRLKGQICFADWSSSLEQVLGKLLTPPASTPTVIQNRESPQPRHHLNPSDESYLSTLIPCPHSCGLNCLGMWEPSKRPSLAVELSCSEAQRSIH